MFKKYFLPILIILAIISLGYLIYYKTNEYKPKEKAIFIIEGEKDSALILSAVAQKNHILKDFDKYLVATLYTDSCRTVIKDTIDYILTYPNLYIYSQTFFELASGFSFFNTYTYTKQGVYLPVDSRIALYSDYKYPKQYDGYAPELQLKLTNRFSLWLLIDPNPPHAHEMFILLDGKPFEKVADISSTEFFYSLIQNAYKFFSKYP